MNNVYQRAIQACSAAIAVIGASLIAGADCYAARPDPQPGNDVVNEQCPGAYRRYKEMENAYGRPQIWQGCDELYSVSREKTHDEESGAITVGIFKESHSDDPRATGLTAVFVHPRGGMAGINAEVIRAPEITYRGAPDTLVSAYGFFGFSLNQPVSPYLEVGVDLLDVLGATLLEGIFGECDPDGTETNSRDCVGVDVYGAIGVQTRAKQHLPFIRVYAKSYAISQEGRTVYVPVVGVSVAWAF